MNGILIDNLTAILNNTKQEGKIPLWLHLYDKNKEFIHVDSMCQLKQLELNNEQYEALMQAQKDEELTFTIERKI